MAVGCVAARGNGISPVIYFVAGFLVLPLAMATASRLCAAKKVAEVGVLVVGAIAGFLSAHISARPGSEMVFNQIFKSSPPAEVRNLETRLQWYDGRMWFAMFSMDEAPFKQLVLEANLEFDRTIPDESGRDCTIPWHSEIGQWSAMAYDFFPRNPALASITIYKQQKQRDFSTESVNLVRDDVTGQIWAVKLDQ